MKEWLKSVLNYESYPQNKTGYPFFWNTLYMGTELNFLVVRVHDIITPFKFGDDLFRGFGLSEGQNAFSHIL